MKIIEKITDQIEEELHDAEKYIMCAQKHREGHPQLAKVYRDLAQEEIRHADKLHSAVADIITEYRQEHGAPPEKMQWVYDYLHERHIEYAENVKRMISS